MLNFLKSSLINTIAILSIAFIGWLLIGFYASYEYLITGYEDWMFHAYKIKYLQDYGLNSWDLRGASGLNHVQAYQYIPHLLTLGIAHLFNLTIPKAMIYMVIATFIYLRLSMYLLLKYFKVPTLYAFTATLISFNFSQQWQTIRDFSLYIVLGYVPVIMFLWCITLKNKSLYPLLAAATGFSWSLHPILGYVTTALLGFNTLINWATISHKLKLLSLLIFVVAFLPFCLPILTLKYKFTNPILSSTAFIRATLQYPYTGLSLTFVMLIILSVIASIFWGRKIATWPKILLTFSILMLGIIELGKSGYTPPLINQFQFSRSLTILATIAVYSFAGIGAGLLVGIKSKLAHTFLAVITIVSLVNSFETASNYSAEPVTNRPNPVAIYFQDQYPTGTIYFADSSESSYFTPSHLRMVNSYNEHLLPNPHSYRFKKLMLSHGMYTGVSNQQKHLIEQYSQVLGIEYLVLPTNSPLVKALTQPDTSNLYEIATSELESQGEYFSVLHNTQPIANAYIMEKKLADQITGQDRLTQPDLRAQTHGIWDDQIKILAGNLDQTVPTAIQFQQPNQLTVDLTPAQAFTNPTLLITQSYDTGWTNNQQLPIHSTSLRFMEIHLDKNLPSTLTLTHAWPKWYWPVQTLGGLTFALTGISTGLIALYSYLSHLKYRSTVNLPKIPLPISSLNFAK